MTTIAVVKKNGIAAIAADTMITFGNTKESAEYVVNHSKIFPYRDNLIAVSGSAGVQMAMEEYFSNLEQPILLDTISAIYRFGLSVHQDLKDNHFLRPEDADDSFETLRGDIAIINPSGIFGMTSYRYVQEYSKFYAIGSGSQFATGAMFSV
jgi:ATP-dependent HslUV protease, peptidase subunit HslV